MLRGLAKQFGRLPDTRMMPDPWIARPLLVLDRQAQDGVDHLELWDEVIMANGMIAMMVGSTEDEIELRILGKRDEEDKVLEPATFDENDALALARRVRAELGEGFHVGVLRSGHPDWIAWKKAHPSIMETVATEAMYRATEQRFAISARTGGRRQRRKPTKAEIRRQAEQQVGDTVQVKLTADDLRRIGEGRPNEFRQQKIGIATILMRGGWRGIEDEYNEVNRYALLGLSSDGKTDEPLRDDEERLVHVLEDQAYGPAPLGDAIAAWLLDASEEADAAHGEWLEDAGDFLPATPPGTDATSEESVSTS
jgi:hypothetical protein